MSQEKVRSMYKHLQDIPFGRYANFECFVNSYEENNISYRLEINGMKNGVLWLSTSNQHFIVTPFEVISRYGYHGKVEFEAQAKIYSNQTEGNDYEQDRK